MNIENAKAQMRKGFLEMISLIIIARKESYSSDILKLLKDNELIIVEGTIYPLLTRLKNADYLNYRWKESVSGPPRKYYFITEKGRLFLDELLADWKMLDNIVNTLQENKN